METRFALRSLSEKIVASDSVTLSLRHNHPRVLFRKFLAWQVSLAIRNVVTNTNSLSLQMSKACSRCVESRHICCVQRIYSNAERELSLWISLLGEAGQGSAGGQSGATRELKSDGGGLVASQSASVVGGVLRGTRRVGQKSGVAADGRKNKRAGLRDADEQRALLPAAGGDGSLPRGSRRHARMTTCRKHGTKRAHEATNGSCLRWRCRGRRDRRRAAFEGARYAS